VRSTGEGTTRSVVEGAGLDAVSLAAPSTGCQDLAWARVGC